MVVKTHSCASLRMPHFDSALIRIIDSQRQDRFWRKGIVDKIKI